MATDCLQEEALAFSMLSPTRNHQAIAERASTAFPSLANMMLSMLPMCVLVALPALRLQLVAGMKKTADPSYNNTMRSTLSTLLPVRRLQMVVRMAKAVSLFCDNMMLSMLPMSLETVKCS